MDKVKIAPLLDGVIIEEIQEPKSALIEIVAKNKPHTSKGKVIFIGKGRYSKDDVVQPTTVKEGDTVFFDRAGTHSVVLNGVDLIYLREGDLLGVLTTD